MLIIIAVIALYDVRRLGEIRAVEKRVQIYHKPNDNNYRLGFGCVILCTPENVENIYIL